ncbi:MAG: sel1 repeat family protein [Chlamydiales bacterium]|nr:sel1 repeat family protein [Chlamydiales bacterium]
MRKIATFLCLTVIYSLNAQEEIQSDAVEVNKQVTPAIEEVMLPDEIEVTKKIEEMDAEIKGSAYGYGIEDEEEYLNPFAKTRKQALEGDSQAQMEMGMLYLKGSEGLDRDVKEAYKWYQMAANQGEPTALYTVGEMHEQGKGTVQDSEKAFHSYLQAANKGLPLALLKVGRMYEKGVGVVLDLRQARHWYTESAQIGDKEGLYRLGKLFFYGQGTEQNLVKSYALFAKAASKGHSKALNMRELSMQGLSSLKIERAEKLSKKTFNRQDY